MRFRLALDTKHRSLKDKDVFADSALSFRAKGLLAYFSTLPEGMSLDTKALASASTEGKQAILTALLELERAGYCEPVAADNSGVKRDAPVSLDSVNLPLFEGQSAAIKENDKRVKLDAKPKEEMRIQHVIDRLNELRKSAWDWKSFTPLSSRHAKNIEHISGRLNEGYSESDLILVLEHLAAVDGGKEESRKYFDCVTPFNTKNFERNLAMARDWDAKGRSAGASNANPGIRRGSEYYEKARKRSNT